MTAFYEEYAKDENPTPSSYYVRYWMGFRVILRVVLSFLTYYQFKRYLALLFFVLFMLVALSISKKISTSAGFLFALSIILVRPYVICTSMQFSICFMIAFVAMLIVPWLKDRAQLDGLFFMELGVVTMYFDFYTAPIIRFGLPLVYLYLLRAKEGQKISFKTIIKYLIAWLAGYVLMWLAKLTLTTLLTDVNGFENGFYSLADRLGVTVSKGQEDYYSIKTALLNVAGTIFADKDGLIIGLAGIALVTAAVFFVFKMRGVKIRALAGHLNLLFIAVIPVVWFMVAAQPTAIHSWFQYRSIALTYWGLGAYLFQVSENSHEIREITKKNNIST